MKSRLHPLFVVSAVAILGSLLAASPAAAKCDPDTSIYDDDFEFMDGSWGQPDDNTFVEDGVLVAKNAYGRMNFQTTNTAANVCVDATIVEAADPINTGAQIYFWWQDWDNYYLLSYWGDGSVQVSRKLKGKWLSVVFVQSVPAVKAGVGQTNHVELDLAANDATVFINGTQVTRFKGKPPKDGGPIGLGENEPEGKPAKVTFDNFIVSPPAE